MGYIFDGKVFAEKKLERLKKDVENLKNKGIACQLVSILVGDDKASHLYVELKKRVGESIGIKVDPEFFGSNVSQSEIIGRIKMFNDDNNISGIMLQLPLPEKFSEVEKDEIVNEILPEKDVDGLGTGSLFVHPTAKAVMEILDYALTKVGSVWGNTQRKICVVGATGMVGKPLIKILQNYPYKIFAVDVNTEDLASVTISADILISCCGVPGIIKKDMVKKNVILIDVGAPVGDIKKAAYEKASFVSPVPGGVGPVTVADLLENVILAAGKE